MLWSGVLMYFRWEEMAPEDRPVEGQWDYFQRDTAVGTTQSP